MAGLLPGILGLTAIMTGAALFVTAAQIGPGFLLYLAMLGEHAVWLLPVHVAVVLPAALFGAALLAASGPGTDDLRTQPSDVIAVTIVASLLSLYLVGWMMPAGYHATNQAVARHTTAPVERSSPRPAGLELPQLWHTESPELRAELVQRLRLTIACVIFGGLAAALIASPLTWSYQTALGGTAVAFIWQMRELFARM